MDVGARGERGVLGESHGDIVVCAVYIVVFLDREDWLARGNLQKNKCICIRSSGRCTAS